MFNDNVASVLGIFAKLIDRLEKIKEKQQTKISTKRSKITELEGEVTAHHNEVVAADTAIAKLKVFTTSGDGDDEEQELSGV